MDTISVRVFRKLQVVAPVRFARAATGNPRRDRPDPDDRGFAMGHRPGSWQKSDARGPMLGLTAGDEVTLKVLREDISADAPIHITSSEPGVVTVTSPVAGTPVGADGEFTIKAADKPANAPAKIQARLGSATGPVLGELEPHVFALRWVRVLAHLVTIDGTATTRTADSLVAHFRQVNDIWRPCGVQFIYVKAATVTERITGTRYRRRDGTMAALPAPLGPGGSYAAAGTVTTNLGASHWEEFSTLLQIYPAANAVNVYFVGAAPEWNGLTYDHDIPRPNGYGIAIADAASATDTAHELGHFLNLDRHSDENATGAIVRRDMWNIRRLMYSVWPPATPAHRHDVGYGPNRYGAVISLKDLPREASDGECQRARSRAANPY